MEEKTEGGTHGKDGCGMRCGCCGCSAIRALVLLLIGGAIGFGISRSCRGQRMCSVETAASMQPESAHTPAATAAPKKAKK